MPIGWTGRTINTVVGCTRVSSGCDHCYAVTQSRRNASMGSAKYAGLVNDGKKHFNGVVREHPSAMKAALKRRIPTTWFVNSMSDTFHDAVSREHQMLLMAMFWATPRHTYQVLTKRPENAAAFFAEVSLEDCILHALAEAAPRLLGVVSEAVEAMPEIPEWPLPNLWLGTSVEDQPTADERIPHLLRCPSAVRYLSMEPLLGPAEVGPYLGTEYGFCQYCDDEAPWANLGWDPCDRCGLDVVKQVGGIDWVIVGGESGPSARPMHPDWVRSVRDQCAEAEVSFTFKQTGNWVPHSELPLDERLNRIIQYPWGHDEPAMVRMPSKDFDRLDGVRHTAMPPHAGMVAMEEVTHV